MAQFLHIQIDITLKKDSTTFLIFLAWLLHIAFGANCCAQDGSLDLTFGFGGRSLVTLDSVDAYGQAVAVQKDGKIVVVGYTEGLPSSEALVMRFTEKGNLDLQFGTAGIVSTRIPQQYVKGVSSMALQNDGKIILAGYVADNLSKALLLIRLDTLGRLDTSFNHSGIILSNILGKPTKIYGMGLQKDGKIVLTGCIEKATADADLLMLRYNPDGSLDPAFDGDGMVVLDFGTTDESGRSLVLQDDGKILVTATDQKQFADGLITLVRFNQDGSQDFSFAQEGKLKTNNSSAGSPSYGAMNSTLLQKDQKILVASTKSTVNDLFSVLARYQNDGSIDQSFGVDGFVEASAASSNFIELGYTLQVQRDGKILRTGYRNGIAGSYYQTRRYLQDGSVDTSFANMGTSLVSFGKGLSAPIAMTLQKDDKILLAGYSIIDGRYEVAVARLLNKASTTAIIDQRILGELSVSPNPMQYTCRIHCNQNLRNAEITIVDRTGQLVYASSNLTGDTFTMSVENLPSGTYYLKVQENGHFGAGQWIVVDH